MRLTVVYVRLIELLQLYNNCVSQEKGYASVPLVRSAPVKDDTTPKDRKNMY